MACVVRRSRPWLGTLVSMRVEGLREAAALTAIDAAFAEVAQIHRCMSFHDAESDISRLHQAEVGAPVGIDLRTVLVLECALRMAAVSDGCFDPTVAAQLVAWGTLPRPAVPEAPDPLASWHDIELIDATHVRLRRRLWLDLGGIAKGYAVDRAIEILVRAGATQALVNAGGDLRVHGAQAESVQLCIGAERRAVATVEVANAAVASSASHGAMQPLQGRWRGVHVHGRRRLPVGAATGVSVVAAQCMHADALTKVLMGATPACSQRVLRSFGAQACIHSTSRGLRMMGEAA
ncbi:MAG: FAD:protein FMN transferase [Rudaea sp.]